MKMKNRIILGAGQCGMKLAFEYFTKFQNKKNELLALSTSTEDSVGIPKTNLVQIATEGSGKKFSTGSNIWAENYGKLLNELEDINESDIIYFVSSGGGSGSSSISLVTDILLSLEKGNRVFLIMVLPFSYEVLPFKANTLRAISSLQENRSDNRISIMLFDNEKLSKIYFNIEKTSDGVIVNTTDLERINEHIVSSTSLVIDLINEYHNPTKFSPFTIDEIEHESVIFSNGFIGVDAKVYNGNKVSVKFDYGNISTAKNVIIAKAIRTRESDYLIKSGAGNFLEKVKKISRKAKNARIMYGVIRTDKIEDGTYIVIANNLSIDKYVNKVKSKVGENIEGFLTKEQREKILTSKERNLFDI